MKRAVPVMALAAGLTCAACAITPARTIGDTSFLMPDRSRAIQLGVWLPAAPADVYQAIASVDGWKTWAVRSAFGEVRVGGVMETSYDPAARQGDANNIKQEFIALIPDRLVVFRTIKTPAGFPNAELYMKTVAIMHLTPEASGTRLTFTHEGFGQGAGFDQLYTFFLKGDAQSLEALQEKFGGAR